MDDKTFQAIEYLANHPIEAFFGGYIWPIAVILCKIADEESLPISATVRRIAKHHPYKVDQEPSTIESEKAEAEYLQSRAKMINILKEEIQVLYIRANESRTLSRLKGNKKSAAGGQPGDATSKGGEL